MSWFRKPPGPEPPAPDSDPGPSPPLPSPDAAREVARGKTLPLFARCCRGRLPVLLVTLAPDRLGQARFQRASSEGLLLEIPEDQFLPLRPLGLLLLSFHLDRRAWSCTVQILEVDNPGGECPIVVRTTLPEQVAASDTRIAFRVPLPPDTPLKVVAELPDGSLVPLRPINISQTGLLVELPVDAGFEPEVGTGLALVLRFGELEAIELAEIRRVQGRRCGVFFAASVKPQAVAGSPLRAVVTECEQAWLRGRVPDAGEP